ncbi:hypothetical protein CRENBAI_010968 [Crenichthys baileyi]|uniref:Uncharacterized protein n=1 Tax=Crenichthys baileyi TaxID=28760 RepID=A0AAV9QYA2_9TELE
MAAEALPPANSVVCCAAINVTILLTFLCTTSAITFSFLLGPWPVSKQQSVHITCSPCSYLLRSRDEKTRYWYGKNSNGKRLQRGPSGAEPGQIRLVVKRHLFQGNQNIVIVCQAQPKKLDPTENLRDDLKTWFL